MTLVKNGLRLLSCKMEIITSRQNKTVKLAHKLANSAKERRKQNLTIFDGISFVKDYAKKHQIKRLIVSQKIYQVEKDFVSQNLVTVVSDDLIDYLSPVKTSSGMLAIVEFSDSEQVDFDQSMIILERIQDAGNLGNIARTCLAFGIKQLILSENSVDPYHPEAIRASAGAVFDLEIVRNLNLVDFIKKHDLNYAVTTPHAGIELKQLLVKNPVFVFGNEGQGVSQEIIDLIDHKVKIKQSDKVESLNLATSVAICLYQQYN